MISEAGSVLAGQGQTPAENEKVNNTIYKEGRLTAALGVCSHLMFILSIQTTDFEL
jgi:hypothetical protein